MYDIIGDIHGHADELKDLLTDLGYSRHGRGFRHAERKIAFVGDFVDRGPAIAQVVEIARATVESGDGLAVMGNHEYNAVAFHTAVPGKRDAWFRTHSEKNLIQHRATLDQLSASELADAIAWFRTLPVALEIDGFRVVHAAWQPGDIDCINTAMGSLGRLTPEFLAMSERRGSDLHGAIENVLKGPELQLPKGLSVVDKGGHERDAVRIKWYENGRGRTYREHHLGSDDIPDIAIEESDLASIEMYPSDAAPVLIGHYWLKGTPTPLAPNVACTDYSVAKGGKLVAYRWDGESELSSNKFHWVGKK